MTRREKIVRLAVILAALLVGAFAYRPPSPAHAQQLGEGMVRSGTVGIQNDTEHQLFWSLICMCGCPRETLGTCTCGTAHMTRRALREELAAGKSIEEIKADYVQRWGTAALSVPPAAAGGRAVWALPLVAILIGAVFVGITLARWRRRSDERDAKTAKDAKRRGDTGDGAPPARDAYDEKLDDELRDLDRE